MIRTDSLILRRPLMVLNARRHRDGDQRGQPVVSTLRRPVLNARRHRDGDQLKALSRAVVLHAVLNARRHRDGDQHRGARST